MKLLRCPGSLFLLLILFMSACTGLPDDTDVARDPGREASLRDSIAVWDSLVTAHTIRHPGEARQYARKALTLALESGDPALITRAYRFLGFSMINTKQDSGFVFYTRGLRIADSCRVTEEKPHLYYNLAVLYEEAQDYQTALAFYDSARRMFTACADFSNVSNAYCAIGNIKHDLFDYVGAREAYDTALTLAVSHHLDKQRAIALANLVKFVDEDTLAIGMQREAISYLNKSAGNEEETAVILLNLGNYLPDPDSALAVYREAVRLGEQASLNEVIIGAYNNMVYSFLEKDDPDRAEVCLTDHAIPLALADSNFDWLSTLYDSYADLWEAKGNFREAFLYERKAMEAKITFDEQRAASQVRLLGALLDLKNKELLIQTKSRQVLAEEGRSRQFQVWLILAVLVASALGVLVFILAQRHRMKLQRQQIESASRILRMEEQEKERLGKELHDLTGQVMLGIAGELDRTGFADIEQKELLRRRVEEIGSGIRQISHRMAKPGMHRLTLTERITELCTNYRKSLGMEIVLNIPDDLPALSPETSLQIYRVVQELLTNAGKYARESLLTLSIRSDGKRFEISYSDEGPGFDKTNLSGEGMGISIIFERIKFTGGVAHLETGPGAGTFWDLSIPLERPVK